MKTAIQPTWHGVEIPAELEPQFRPTIRRLYLKLADTAQRRKWEFYFWADRTPKRMQFHLFVMPWEFGSSELMDMSKPRDVAVRLLAGPASVSHGNHFLSIDSFEHGPGMIVLEATLQAISEQLR